MRYSDFKEAIRTELCANRAGLTWVEIRDRLALSYKQPCPEWVNRLEKEIGLRRSRGATAAYVWKIDET